MSKHSASGAPPPRATNAAPAAPAAGPDSTVQAAWSGGRGEVDQPAVRLHDRRLGQLRCAGPVDEAPQVARQQRRQRRVDLGGRRALVLAERADDLVRERDVRVGQRLRERLADRQLVLGVAVGVQQHDRDRLRPGGRDTRCDERRSSLVARARAAARRASSARARRTAARRARAAPAAPRTAGRAARGSGGRARRCR